MRNILLAYTFLMAMPWSAMAQNPNSNPDGFAIPPVEMVPARPGGSLPGVVRPSGPPVAPNLTVPTQATPSTVPQRAPIPASPPVSAQVQTPVSPPVQSNQTPVPPPPLTNQNSGQGTGNLPNNAGTFSNAPGAPGLLQIQQGQQGQQPAPNARLTPEQRDEHFLRALEGLITLTPGQVRQTRRAADEFAREAVRPSVNPTPMTRSITMTLRPGEAIPVLRTFPGNTTNLTFADATGAPWPVQTVVSGNPNAIKVERAAPDGVPTNIVVVSPLQQFAFLNNLVVTLVGNPVPIIFAIETGNSGHVDFRVDVNLRGRGPNAAVEPTGIATLAPTNDSTMQAFVDGIAPQGARRMFSSRPDVEVWRLNDVMYVRTPLELLSPAATARASHVSGVKVYSLMYAPVLILTQNGQRVRVTVDDRRGGTQR